LVGYIVDNVKFTNMTIIKASAHKIKKVLILVKQV